MREILVRLLLLPMALVGTLVAVSLCGGVVWSWYKHRLVKGIFSVKDVELITFFDWAFVVIFGVYIITPLIKCLMRVNPIYLGGKNSERHLIDTFTIIYSLLIWGFFVYLFLPEPQVLNIFLGCLVIAFFFAWQRWKSRTITGALFLRRFGGVPDRVFIPRIKQALPSGVRLNMLVDKSLSAKNLDMTNLALSGISLLSPLKSITSYYCGSDVEWVSNAKRLIKDCNYVIIDLSDLSDSIITEIQLLKSAGVINKVFWITTASKTKCSQYLADRNVYVESCKIFTYSDNDFTFSGVKLAITYLMLVFGLVFLGHSLVVIAENLCSFYKQALVFLFGVADVVNVTGKTESSSTINPAVYLILFVTLTIFLALKIVGFKHFKRKSSKRLIDALKASYPTHYNQDR